MIQRGKFEPCSKRFVPTLPETHPDSGRTSPTADTRPLALRPSDVHLWVVFEHEVPRLLLDSYRSLLTDDERAREKRFSFARDQTRYVVTRALVRVVLSRYAAVAPAHWRFKTNAFGRPELVHTTHIQQRLFFNVSHTAGMILCGVAATPGIGIDVENFLNRPVSLDIANRFFCPEEAASLAQAPLEQRPHKFFQYWTLKEAYVKATGRGMSLRLDSFCFTLSDDDQYIRLAFRRGSEDTSKNWRFWLLRPAPEHVAAVCVRRAADQDIVVRRVVPLQSDEPATELEILRHSP